MTTPDQDVPILTVGEGLVLTLPSPRYAPAVLDYFVRNGEYLSPWSPPVPDSFFSEDFWTERLAKNRQELQLTRSLRLFLVGEKQGEVLGACSFTDIVRGAFRSCHLGYSIDRQQQGRGVMTKVLRVAIPFVFEELRLHRIEANYMPTNERSGAVLRRLGFDVNGYARDYLFISGAWRDHVLTSLTNPDASVVAI